jgi:hypothetical protein
MLNKNKLEKRPILKKVCEIKWGMIFRDTKFFVKNAKYYHRWRGLGLIHKEFKYGHLEPLLEETMLLVAQATIEKIKQPSFLN